MMKRSPFREARSHRLPLWPPLARLREGARFRGIVVARAFAILLASILLLGSGASQAALYWCSMSGEVAAACCCKAAASAESGAQPLAEHLLEPASSLERASCCEMTVHEVTVLPATWETSSQLLAAPPPQMTQVEPVLLRAAIARETQKFALGPRGPPDLTAVPLFVHHCRYLI